MHPISRGDERYRCIVCIYVLLGYARIAFRNVTQDIWSAALIHIGGFRRWLCPQYALSIANMLSQQ